MLVENIEIGKLIDMFANKSAKNDFFSLIGLEMLGSKIKIKAGNKKKVKTKEANKPYVIIQPKSITGFMSLNTKDKKAQIVVNTAVILFSILMTLILILL